VLADVLFASCGLVDRARATYLRSSRFVFDPLTDSVFALGTWLRENKNIEYFVKEPRDRESGVGEKK
jgi:hypothetical protein